MKRGVLTFAVLGCILFSNSQAFGGGHMPDETSISLGIKLLQLYGIPYGHGIHGVGGVKVGDENKEGIVVYFSNGLSGPTWELNEWSLNQDGNFLVKNWRFSEKEIKYWKFIRFRGMGKIEFSSFPRPVTDEEMPMAIEKSRLAWEILRNSVSSPP